MALKVCPQGPRRGYRGAGGRRCFRAMMATWHPLGEPSCPGARVNDWITAAASRPPRRPRVLHKPAGTRRRATASSAGPRGPVTPTSPRWSVMTAFSSFHRWRSRGWPAMPWPWPAAGWQRCREETSGTPPGAQGPGVRRAVWMKPLADDWRGVLCEEPRRVMGRAAPLVAPLADKGCRLGTLRVWPQRPQRWACPRAPCRHGACVE